MIPRIDPTTPAIAPEKIASARRIIRREQDARNAYEDDKRMSNHAHWIGTISDLNDLAREVLPALLDLAQSVLSAQAETGWRSIPEAVADGERAIVAVRKGGDGEWIVGEAYYRADETASASSEVGWWWAGEDPGDYCAEAIHVHHGEPEFYMPLPPPPAKGGE